MKKSLLTLLLASATAVGAIAQPAIAGYPYQQVPFTSVKLGPKFILWPTPEGCKGGDNPTGFQQM